jgi:hypothetical protein
MPPNQKVASLENRSDPIHNINHQKRIDMSGTFASNQKFLDLHLGGLLY